MKKTPAAKKPLALSTQTLRTLQDVQLAQVDGGTPPKSGCIFQQCGVCPTTN